MDNKKRKISTPSGKSANKKVPASNDARHKNRFEQLLDDAVFGVKKK